MRGRQWLVVAQVALAFVLLAGAGVLLMSFHRLRQVDLGVRTDDVLTYELHLPDARYDSIGRARLYEDLAAQVEALPGVRAAGGICEVGDLGLGRLGPLDHGLDLGGRLRGRLAARWIDEPGLDHEVRELVGDRGQRQRERGQRRPRTAPIGPRVELAEADDARVGGDDCDEGRPEIRIGFVIRESRAVETAR